MAEFLIFKGLDLWIPKTDTPCKGEYALFDADYTQRKDDYYEEHAKELCITSCQFRKECLEAALVEELGVNRHLRCGIRGGTTPRERVLMEARNKNE